MERHNAAGARHIHVPKKEGGGGGGGGRRANKMRRKAKDCAVFWKEAGTAMQLSWQGNSG